MKKLFWIFVIIAGGILMIVGSAIGSATFYQYLYTLTDPYIGLEFKALVSSIFKALEYIAFFGGYFVLVAAFLILLKWYRVGRIIITIATGFGMLGLIIYVITWIVGYFGIPLDPTWLTVLNTISSYFTYNTGIAFAGTAIAVVGKFFLKRAVRAEKADEKKAEAQESTEKNNTNSKFCPSCGAKLPTHANFCNKCGKTFD